MSKITEDMINPRLKKELDKQKELNDLQVSFDEIDGFNDKNNIRTMYADIFRYTKMLEQKITFVNKSLTNVIPFTRENLYLICAYTGSGKSTIAANITYPLWQEQKKVLVITNEESQQDVLYRIACLHLGYNFNEYKKGLMTPEKMTEVMKLFPQIAECVKVIDVNYKGGLTTKLEGIKNALEAVKSSDYSCALIDYYQLIQYSSADSSKSRYDVLNDLRIWLGLYIKKSNIPIVLFAQLHSTGKRNMVDIDGRIKECSAIIEPATVIIEAIPNFNDSTTVFAIHKDRFGYAGKKVTCGFENGRYVEYTDAFKQAVQAKKLAEISNGMTQVQSFTVEDIKDE